MNQVEINKLIKDQAKNNDDFSSVKKTINNICSDLKDNQVKLRKLEYKLTEDCSLNYWIKIELLNY